MPGPPGGAPGGRFESRIAALLASRAGVASARAGDQLLVRPDRLLLDGPTAAAVLDTFQVRPGPRAPARRTPRAGPPASPPPLVEPVRFVAVAGATQPRADQRRVAAFAAAHGWAIGLQPALAGLPSVVATDEGLISSSDVVAGARPDTGALGGLGCAALRCDPAELAALLAEPRLPVVVPATRFVRVSGRLPRWAGPFDLALSVLDAAGGVPALRGAVLELHGDTLDALEVAERLALCGALAAAGVGSLVAPDRRTSAFLAARRPVAEPPAPPADVATPESGWIEVDARRVPLAALQLTAPGPAGGPLGPLPGRRLDPTAAPPQGKAAKAGQAERAEGTQSTGADGEAGRAGEPGRRGRREAPEESAGAPGAALVTAVGEVFLGGRIEDLRVAGEVLRDRNVRRGLYLAIQPASQRVLLHAIEEGLAADFLRAGASLLPPGAAPPPATGGELRLLTSGGGPGDIVVGPAVAAASAVAGRLCDPEGMRRSNRRAARLG
jgi:3-isopropylmalate/(R)-2-methylmalate dehydratase large subunit